MPPRPRRGRHLGGLAGAAALAMVAAGCGGGSQDETTGSAPSTTTTAAAARPDVLAADVRVQAEDIDFPQDAFRATAGEVTIAYVNEGEIFHTLVLERAGGDGVDGWDRLEVSEHDDAALATVTLTPGDYLLYCDVAGHRTAGMEATLTVEP